MNDKVRIAVTLLPVILVPLFSERKRIKKHPDMQKLGTATDSVYSTAKDKSANAVNTVRNAGSSTFHTGKSAAQTVSSKVSDKRHERAYKKDIKTYQDSIKQEQSLSKQFEKEKKKHRAKRLKEESGIKIPEIMLSHSEPDNKEKTDLMSADEELLPIASSNEDDEARLAITTTDEPGDNDSGDSSVHAEDMTDNYDAENITVKSSENMTKNINPYTEEKVQELESPEYESGELHKQQREALDSKNAADSTVDEENITVKGTDNMTKSLNPDIEEKVHGYEFPGYESGELHKQHKKALDSKSGDAKITVEETEKDDSLFGRHREFQEDHIASIGRKSGIESAMSKSKKQKKIEKKINRHLDKNYS